MTGTIITEERNIANALISGLANLTETPMREQVEEKAKQIAAIFGYTGDLRNIITEAMISVDTRMGAGVSLVDVTAKHDDQWVRKREDITWTYSGAYENFLLKDGWAPRMVQSLSDVTTRVLGHLQDPVSEGTTWNRRGLVIGHVQSGKTANYTGLIARAADAGYKFIIVIAGIHNNLRKQTQERIDEAFIGRSSDPEDRRSIGVGLTPGYPHPATLTNINEDFNKNTAAKSGWKINDFSKPIILIIKKNVTTLTALHKWLKALNAEGDGRISDVPMLLIDDEADNASINTNKEDLDPTRTNAMIRRILGLFAKSCYVGYTATPFANIFINPDAYDDDVREELFPRDFIYCLDAPTTYFGAEKVFLDDEASQSIVKPIDDCEDFLPYRHKRDDPQPEGEAEAIDPELVEDEQAENGDEDVQDFEDEDEEPGKPISDSLIRDLSAHRTLALRVALGEQPGVALIALTHTLTAQLFYSYAEAGCLEIRPTVTPLGGHAAGIEDTPLAARASEAHDAWAERMPRDVADLWGFIVALDDEQRMALLAHCASRTVNALRLPWDRKPRTLQTADRLASALALDMAKDWTPTVDSYLGRVTKAHILEAVAEGVSEDAARRIADKKKPDMAEAAEQRLAGKGWLPAVLRTLEPEAEPVETEDAEGIAPTSEAKAPDTGAQDGEAVEVEAVEQPTEPEAVDADADPADEADAYSVAAE